MDLTQRKQRSESACLKDFPVLQITARWPNSADPTASRISSILSADQGNPKNWHLATAPWPATIILPSLPPHAKRSSAQQHMVASKIAGHDVQLEVDDAAAARLQ
jgi:hypothetical protein